MKKLLLMSVTLVLFAFVSHEALAQTVTGKVISSEDNTGIPGVNVLIQGTSTGVVTDFEGNYRINVNSGDVLVFSYVSFITKSVAVNNQSVIDVTLDPDITSLSEVVVTGYASQQKKDLTGAVGVVEPTELTAIPTGNVANQLQGRVAGVTVVGSGQPGTTSKIRIRGFGSFGANNPLYVVDGVQTFDISTLNPADVESLNVLKDAGAASIYGSRASNGVIIITTKKGKSGVQFNYDMYVGTQNPGGGPEGLVNTQGYMDLQQLVYDNDGTTETHPIYGPSGNLSLPSWAAQTDWFDEITDNAGIQNHDLSFSGGNDNARFFGGVGYFRQDGIIKHTYSQRVSARFNSEFKVANDRIKIGENMTVSHRSGNGVSNLSEGSPIQMGSYRTQPIIPAVISAANNPPITGISHTYVEGEWGGTGLAPRLGNSSNVLADLTRDKDDISFDVRFVGSAFIDVKVIEGLNFRSTLGGTIQNTYFTNYTFATYERSENVGTPSFSEGASYNAEWVWTNTLTLDKTFNEVHRILAVAGYEALEYGLGRSVSGRRAGYFSDAVDFRTLNTGASIQDANSSASTGTAMVSQFLRGDYVFNDKYMLSATVRRDGSSRFGTENQFGVFPSFSVGWRLSDEAFLAGSTWLADLKLRGGWGQMGNQLAISPNNQYFLYGGSAGTSNYDLNGTGTSSLQGFRPTRIGNPEAKWETNTTTNIGIDASFADNKIELIVDWYNKVTEDLLFVLDLPGTAGAAEPPAVNIASMKNTGLDLQLIYRNQWGDFGFEGNATFTSYKNEITKIADGVEFFDEGGSRIGSFSRNEVGHAMSSFYGYQVMGLFQSASEVSGAAAQDGAEEGFFRYADSDGDGTITPDDRVYIGDPNPDFTYGLNLTFTYKNFDLTTFLYGSQGNDIFNWNLWWTDFWPSFQGQKSTNLLNNSWTPSNTGATTPKASNVSNFSTNTQSVSYYIEDGSFMRMKNLQIGYNFPQNALSSIGLRSLRVYVQGINLLTATKYSGLDPELGGIDTNFGVDRGNYPNVKQFLFGLNIGL
jgi:TonB-linked SusC/RagA family outer membrane protein